MPRRLPSAPMQLCVWNQTRLEIPNDWEMLRFSKSPNEGTCAFADRYSIRLEWTWKAVPHPPDFPRILTAYRQNLEASGRLEDGAIEEAGGWHGLLGRERAPQKTWTVKQGVLSPELVECRRSVSRWGRHLPELGRMVELVFLCDGERDRALEGSVLRSVRPDAVRPGDLRRWCAFGLDALAPAEFRLAACTVEPAACRLQFASEDEQQSWHVQRLGMVDQWLTASVPEWLSRQHPPGLENLCAGERPVSGHPIAYASASVPARGRRVPARRYDMAAWRCPRDGRLYSLKRLLHRPPGAAIERAPGLELTCCSALGVLG